MQICSLFKCMLQLIKTGLDKHRYDEVMETAWSALWNVTGLFEEMIVYSFMETDKIQRNWIR